ncbi:beta-1 [Perilla frutescens var. hirtella]|uniref:Beta-1 n=1 Tax=Perilla frutescens var. hirtella TaxID=608512 RepID=A0AAD4JHT1_PERFH|nr:beta-1 [Perilla frutescens var. hirtella]
MCNSSRRGRGIRERKEGCMNIEKEKVCARMISDGYYTSKKSDEICEDVCDEQASPSFVSMSRVRCLLHGVDFRVIFFFLLIAPAGVITIYCHGQKLTYFLRPLWESPPKPFVPLTHYYNQNVSMETLCKLHGWGIREFPRRVYDAVLFSNEVDMLTIRWKELYPYITRYVLLESNSTFTGLPKPHNFAIHREQFKFIEPRLTYGEIGGRFRRGENPFVEEAYQRLALDQLLRVAGIEDDDLLIMSDVDEIPSGHTINLLRWCDDIPPVLHLQLKNYLYSFEFQQHQLSWRASIHRYEKGKTKYAHYRQTDYLLSDSGWHCSFCFRSLSDFIFKMKAYSHSDRVRFSRFLNPKRIQEVICKGGDLYDMLPEEYTFRDIIGTMGPIPHSLSAVNLPSYLLENAAKYKYLLPGNCFRERR